MKHIKSLFVLSAIGLMSLTSCGKSSSSPSKAMYDQYDKIIYGNIFVGESNDKTVEAVVIKDGRIEYAGSKAGAKEYESRTVEITTLDNGEFVMPGIVDGHSHPAVSWDNKINSLVFGPADFMDDYISGFTSYCEKHSGDVVIRSQGFIESRFDAEQAKNPKAILDAICDTIPIVATDAGGHCIWTNSKAIEIISEKYPNVKVVDPDNPGHDNNSIPGGTVERNADGEAIGLFRDKATAIANAACVKFTKDSYRRAILKAQEEYASIGYTSYNESMINESSDVTQTPKYEAYTELEKEGLLTSYVAGSFIVGNRADTDALVDQAIELKNESRGGNFEVTDIKIFMDGVIEGGSAYLKEPYVHNVDGSLADGYRGSSSWAGDLDKLTNVIAKANNAGMACHFHAVGDQASLDALYCIEKAAEKIGIDKVKAARNVVTHLQIVDPSIYDKFKKYDVIANLNPWANKGPGFYQETEVLVLGEERASKEYPYKSWLDKGVNCSFGTDYGSSAIYNLNESFLVLTKRKYYDAVQEKVLQETLLNESEQLSPSQALKLFTAGGAYQMHRENEFGKIEEGKYANLIVLNKNLLTVAEDDIMSVSAQKTMFKGNWVYTK